MEVTTGSTRSLIGIGLLLLSALGFTVAMLSANVAYRDGMDVHSTNLVRYITTAVLIFFIQKIRSRNLKLPPRERYTSLALGISVFMMGAGYLGATQYISVSLAVLLFYTAPFLVALTARFTENEPLTGVRLIAILLAFAGLGLALEIQSFAALDWRGIAFGFLSGVGCASFVVANSLTMRTADPQAVNFHCLVGGTALFALFLIVIGGPTGTFTPLALLKAGGSGIALTVGYITFFVGLGIVGPVKTAMLLNAEPMYTIILAAIFLGDRLSSTQWAGAALVITGIILITGGFGKKKDPEA
jgi:drug/metabolite transporter (DMT)-like permease